MSIAVAPERGRQAPFMTVRVRDPNGHRQVVLEGVRPSATVPEIRARAIAALRLPSDVDWNLRQDRTGRLLREEQRLNEFVDDDEPQAELTMQPDASLG